MSKGLATYDPPRQSPRIHPDVPHRLLACTRCGNPWYVIELPAPWTDPGAFVGPCCATLKEQR